MEKIEFQLFGSLKKRIVYRIVKKSYNKKPLDNQGVLVVVPSGENANKFNEHLELILEFMGVLEHEPELWDQIKQP
jgi:hypothetical protein